MIGGFFRVSVFSALCVSVFLLCALLCFCVSAFVCFCVSVVFCFVSLLWVLCFRFVGFRVSVCFCFVVFVGLCVFALRRLFVFSICGFVGLCLLLLLAFANGFRLVGVLLVAVSCGCALCSHFAPDRLVFHYVFALG